MKIKLLKDIQVDRMCEPIIKGSKFTVVKNKPREQLINQVCKLSFFELCEKIPKLKKLTIEYKGLGFAEILYKRYTSSVNSMRVRKKEIILPYEILVSTPYGEVPLRANEFIEVKSIKNKGVTNDKKNKKSNRHSS